MSPYIRSHKPTETFIFAQAWLCWSSNLRRYRAISDQLLSGDHAARKTFGAHVSENLHRDQVFAVCAPFERFSAVFATQPESPDGPRFDRQGFRNKKKFTGPLRRTKKNAALQIGSKGIELVTQRRLHSSFDWFFQSMMLFTLHTFAIDEAEDGRSQLFEF